MDIPQATAAGLVTPPALFFLPREESPVKGGGLLPSQATLSAGEPVGEVVRLFLFGAP
jgi:hypothetical protein